MRLALLEFKAKITSDTFGAMSSWNDIEHPLLSMARDYLWSPT